MKSCEPWAAIRYSVLRLTYRRCSTGAVIIFLEVRPPTEEHKAIIQKYASFMHSFIGRGVCKSYHLECIAA